MEQGIYTGSRIVYGRRFGILVPRGEYDLPEDFSLEHEPFEPLTDVVLSERVKHADNAEKMPFIKST